VGRSKKGREKREERGRRKSSCLQAAGRNIISLTVKKKRYSDGKVGEENTRPSEEIHEREERKKGGVLVGQKKSERSDPEEKERQ